jgi:hypothetical protein
MRLNSESKEHHQEHQDAYQNTLECLKEVNATKKQRAIARKGM